MDIFEYLDEDFDFDFVSHNLKQNAPVDEYEGYSKNEIQEVLYNLFGEKSPVRVRKDIPDTILDLIPFFRLCEYLLNYIDKSDKVKLTKLGNLPVKLVKHLYEQRFITEYEIETGFSKLYKEEDSLTINVAHLVLKFAGLLKKRNNVLSITKNGLKVKSDRVELLKIIMETFVMRFNWASLDGHGNSRSGQFGIGYTLLMLNRYGNKMQGSGFYSNKYLYAFPALLNDYIINKYYESADIEMDFIRCFTIRTFERYLELFNLVETEFDGNEFMKQNVRVKTSQLFHSVFVFDG